MHLLGADRGLVPSGDFIFACITKYRGPMLNSQCWPPVCLISGPGSEFGRRPGDKCPAAALYSLPVPKYRGPMLNSRCWPPVCPISAPGSEL